MSIEEKAKEYAVNEIVSKLGHTIFYSPIMSAAIMSQSEVAFKEGADWMLEKAIHWIKSNVGKYPEINWDQQEWYSNKERLIKDFKQVMEE